eukprot:TRINITY_DN7391_c0_g1_i2.p1 TRINITY_DN7391_c0_g1~~TRINITY_DN7391_c0_g1_i2.p1  ORF type:complete len:393 (+),score=67.38 TRINITY_DN7391_c0_g1_i2:45-1223(+)
MMVDLLELRASGWKQRRKVEGPKTIEQVHADAAEEDARKRRAMGVQDPRAARPASARPGAANPSQPSPTLIARPSSGSFDRNRPVQDIRIMRNEPRQAAPSSPVGPQGQAGRGVARQIERRPSSGDSSLSRRRASSIDNEEISLAPAATNRGAGRGRVSISTPPLNAESPNSSPSLSPALPPPAVAAPAPMSLRKEMTEEKAKEHVQALVQEYWESKDFQEAVTCVRELTSSAYHSILVADALTLSFDKHDRERARTADLLCSLYEAQVISKDSFLRGLQTLLPLLEDLAIDAPKISSYMGEYLSRFVACNILSMSYFSTAVLEEVKDDMLVEKILGFTLKNLLQESQQAFDQAKSDLDIKSLLSDQSPEGVSKFLQKYGLENAFPEYAQAS